MPGAPPVDDSGPVGSEPAGNVDEPLASEPVGDPVAAPDLPVAEDAQPTPAQPQSPPQPPAGSDALATGAPLPPIPPTPPSAHSGSQMPARTRRERRTDATDTRARWPWIVGAVALVVVVTIAGVVIRRGSGSGPTTSTPAQSALLRSAAVADSVRADCRGTTRLPADATAGLVCTPVEGANRVRFYRFSTDDALTEYFDRQVERAGVVRDSEADCSQVVDVEHAYQTVRGLDGRVACYRSGGRSTLVWTMPEATAVGVAERFDTDDQSVYDWWNLAYQVELDPESLRVELTDGEIELLKRVPTDVQTTCGPEDPSEVLVGATASLACVVSDTDVFYTAYTSVAAMTAVYEEQRTLAEVEAGTGGVTGETCPGDGPYRVGAPSQGSMLCYLDGSAARATWTDGLPSQLPETRPASLPDPQWWILTEAIRRDDKFGPLMTLVADLGPAASLGPAATLGPAG